MALRSEDLYVGPDARVVAFPTERVRARARQQEAVQRSLGVLIALSIVMVSLFLLASGPSGVASAEGERRVPRAVTLETGDTLWDVAGRFAPEGVDVRAYVDRLIELNGIEGAPLAGQRILLPR